MVHQYQLGGYNIVLDVCSGSVHAVDEVAYEIIKIFENNDKQSVIDAVCQKFNNRSDITENDVIECYEQVEELKNTGKLFAPDTFQSMAGKLKQKTSGVIKALCMHIAHTCNLNCSYCFASQGKYHGERAVMSFEVGKRALDFLVENSGTRRNLEVDFFGGEPLMNFEVVKQLVAYARSIEKEKNKNFRFTLTTNGMLIDDEVIEFANKESNPMYAHNYDSYYFNFIPHGVTANLNPGADVNVPAWITDIGTAQFAGFNVSGTINFHDGVKSISTP